MASRDSRSSSVDSFPSQDSSVALKQPLNSLVAVPGANLRQATQSPSEDNSQIAKGGVEVKWMFSGALEGPSPSSAILE